MPAKQQIREKELKRVRVEIIVLEYYLSRVKWRTYDFRRFQIVCT